LIHIEILESAKQARELRHNHCKRRYGLSQSIVRNRLPNDSYSGSAGFQTQNETGYRAWIRTMNNASKGRCVTVTPRGKEESVT
jgi:hypothetical protein